MREDALERTKSMQYPPQPLAGRPQADEPGHEAAPDQKIIVYADRIKATRLLDAMLYRMVFVALVSFPLSYIILSLVKSGAPGGPLLSFFLILFADVLLFAKLALAYWVARRSLLVNSTPVILVDGEGISLRGALSLDDTFIAWNEIEALDIYTYKQNYFCVRPRNAPLLTRRMPLLERILKLSNRVYGIPPLSVSGFYTDKPVEEILQQLYHMYAKELSLYHVHIQP